MTRYVSDYFSTLTESGEIGYAKSYYWDFLVNNVRMPEARRFEVDTDRALIIRRTIEDCIREQS